MILKRKNHQLEFDSVTGLPNYDHFKRNVSKLLSCARPKEYMILSFNIDNLGLINETYGTRTGNEILKRVGKHFLKQCQKNEYIVRFYADNFIFFTRNPDFFWNVEERVFVMTTVKDILKDILPERYNFTFTTSVYYIDTPSDSIDSMIDKANLAQKLCRHTHATHRVIEYTEEMRTSHEWNREITMTMENAFLNKEFEVFYQPKYDFTTEEVMGAEALIRWNNPRKGFLQPGKFVPLFEDNGFIEKIDKFVFKKVCDFLDKWNKTMESRKLRPLTISFNLSRYHLYNPNLIRELKTIANEYDIGDNKIEVELTESIMFDNQQKLINVMKEIKKAGFSVSVDDFGSGYSSLNLLKNMPADVIKLDKEFLSITPENQKENIIITSVIEMAKKLKIKTVAEGVETQEQCVMLKNIGCDIAQGFFYAKPMREDDFRNLLSTSAEKVG
ncbi:MAG: EAL domain-containing protein [Treponema sp.]|nr:EAL domain-containing protein [Candidatus Treponema equi]